MTQEIDLVYVDMTFRLKTVYDKKLAKMSFEIVFVNENKMFFEVPIHKKKNVKL